MAAGYTVLCSLRQLRLSLRCIFRVDVTASGSINTQARAPTVI